MKITNKQIMKLYNIAREKYPDDVGDISVNPISWSIFIDNEELEFKQNSEIHSYLKNYIKKVPTNITIKVTKEELQALMDCIAIADDSVSNQVLMVSMKAEKRIAKVNLDELWAKLFKIRKKEKEKKDADKEVGAGRKKITKEKMKNLIYDILASNNRIGRHGKIVFYTNDALRDIMTLLDRVIL